MDKVSLKDQLHLMENPNVPASDCKFLEPEFQEKGMALYRTAPLHQ
jgi:hypothetical protein